jgi:hypothetical protein
VQISSRLRPPLKSTEHPESLKAKGARSLHPHHPLLLPPFRAMPLRGRAVPLRPKPLLSLPSSRNVAARPKPRPHRPFRRLRHRLRLRHVLHQHQRLPHRFRLRHVPPQHQRLSLVRQLRRLPGQMSPHLRLTSPHLRRSR